MTDQLADQLRASSINDNVAASSSSEDWKQNLNIPTKDGRQQTEVGTP